MQSIILRGQLCLHDAGKNNVKVKSYLYGELNCDGLHILIISFRRIGAYHYSTAYILHPHIAMAVV